jgi:hypothetical protein
MNKPREGGVRKPVLLLSGEWIAAAGFAIGARYIAFSPAENCLVLMVNEPAPAADEPERQP